MSDSTEPVMQDLGESFPPSLLSDSGPALAVLPPSPHKLLGNVSVSVGDEQVSIPYRIYNPEPDPVTPDSLSESAAVMVHCLYTRHHNGFVRQKHLPPLFAADQNWVAPFVLQLVGEYVVEIIQLILENQASLNLEGYGQFTAQNPEFVARTKRRIVSYWDCYYRGEYPSFTKYPGFLVAEAFGWWGFNDIPRISSH